MHRVSRRLPAEPKVKEDADDAPYEGEDTHEDAEATREALMAAGVAIDALFAFIDSDKLKLADLF